MALAWQESITEHRSRKLWACPVIQPPLAWAETHACKSFLQPLGFPLQPSGKKTIPTKTSIVPQELAIIYRHKAAQIHAEKSNILPQKATQPVEREGRRGSWDSLSSAVSLQLGGWIRQVFPGTSLEAQWLRLCTPSEEGTSIIPGWGTKVLHATRCSQKKKKKTQYLSCNCIQSFFFLNHASSASRRPQPLIHC